MISKIVIEKKICLNSEYLSGDIKSHLLNKIRDMTLNECTKDYGYFLNVNKIDRIKDNFISSNCENVFSVLFEVDVLKPEINKVFMGKVCMIFLNGIFINIKDKLKVLIPISAITEYKFDQENKCFNLIDLKDKKKKKVIKNDDELNVIISGIKYSKKNFSCFGLLKH
jgi:DNA-directed RNA polymerase subunit E'/Rpb7